MGSEYYKAELSITGIEIEEDETEQIASGTNFVDIHDISNREIKDEAIEFKSCSEYGMLHECLETNGNEKCYYPNSREFEVPRSSVEGPKELKFSSTHFNGLAGELENHKVVHFNNGVILKNEDEDQPEYIDFLTNNAGLKTETLEAEDDINTVYGDVKHEICEEKFSGKNESKFYPNSVADILIGTDIGPNSLHEFSIDYETWPQQNIEVDGTAVERDNDSRKEPTVTTNSKFNERPYTGEKSFQCKSCSHSFNIKYNLLQHNKIHTGQKKFQCKICEKSYNQKGNLTIHERIHSGEKPFQCKVCLKSFGDKHKLLRHERIHTGEKPFQCKMCLKSFGEKHKLLRHKRIHTGEKPFKCKICEKSFNRKGNLKIHERIHTGEKPFQCEICLKSFIQKADLMKHERIHTGEKPFRCEICTKTFIQKVNLTIHERIHTGEKSVQCKISEKST